MNVKVILLNNQPTSGSCDQQQNGFYESGRYHASPLLRPSTSISPRSRAASAPPASPSVLAGRARRGARGRPTTRASPR